MTTKTAFSIEYDFQASPQLLFQYLSTPSGLSEWFADNVNSRGEDYTFIWDDTEEYAKLIQKKNNERVRFRWINDEEDQDDSFFSVDMFFISCCRYLRLSSVCLFCIA